MSNIIDDLEEMASLFKKLLGRNDWIEELNNVQEGTEKEVKRINIIDTKLQKQFWEKINIKSINIYSIWKEFKTILEDKIKKAFNAKEESKITKDNFNYKVLLSIELHILLSRLLNLEKIIDFNKNYDFSDFEYLIVEEVFVLLVNVLDKLNLIPIKIWRTTNDKSESDNITKKVFWSELTKEELEWLNKERNLSFKNVFFSKKFKKIDKLNFYDNFLLKSRNQRVHYPEIDPLDYETRIKYILNINCSFKQKIILSLIYSKHAILLATIYLYLVFEEMINIDWSNYEDFFSIIK